MSRSSQLAGRAFSPLAMIVVVLVGVVSMAGLGVLSAYAPELKSGNDGGVHALSNSAVGFGGIAKLVRMTGTPVTLSRGTLGENAFDSLVVLTPAVGINPDQVADRDNSRPGRRSRRSDAPIEVRRLDPEDDKASPPHTSTNRPAAAARPINPGGGPALIILPKWATLPDQKRRGWVTTAGTYDTRSILQVLPKSFQTGAVLTQRKGRASLALRRPSGTPVGSAVQIENLQTLSGPGWIPVVTDPSGAPVLAMKEGTWTYVLADPDLLNTSGLKTLAGAQTALALLDLVHTSDTPIIFDLTLHGFQRTRSVLRLMLEPPLLGATLLLAAIAILAGFQAVARFGPAREKGRTIALGKRALADNTAALVRLARREASMATPYAVLIRAWVVRAIGAPRSLNEAELSAFLDRVSASSNTTATYSALAHQAAVAKTPQDLMQVARDLNRWKQEMTRGRQ
jgi:hypothetical protein